MTKIQAITGLFILISIILIGLLVLPHIKIGKIEPTKETDEEFCNRVSREWSINHIPAYCLKYIQ